MNTLVIILDTMPEASPHLVSAEHPPADVDD